MGFFMDIDCIGCLHGYYPKLFGGDLLIVTGDLTSRDEPIEHLEFIQWLDVQPYKHKIVIAGNHDHNIDGDEIDSLENTYYLKNELITIEDVTFWGSPHSLWFDRINPKCCAFTSHDTELVNVYSHIPDETNVLISHTPFHGMLDQNRDGYHCGSKSLRDAIDRVKPILFVCSHIHEQGGNEMMYKHQGPNTWCVNCSIMNEKYQPVNQPIRMII